MDEEFNVVITRYYSFFFLTGVGGGGGGYTLRSTRNSGQMATWGAYWHTKELRLTQDP